MFVLLGVAVDMTVGITVVVGELSKVMVMTFVSVIATANTSPVLSVAPWVCTETVTVSRENTARPGVAVAVSDGASPSTPA